MSNDNEPDYDDEDDDAYEEAPDNLPDFIPISERSRQALAAVLEHANLQLAQRAMDPDDKNVVRDAKILVDCTIKIERLNMMQQLHIRDLPPPPYAGPNEGQIARAIVDYDPEYREYQWIKARPENQPDPEPPFVETEAMRIRSQRDKERGWEDQTSVEREIMSKWRASLKIRLPKKGEHFWENPSLWPELKEELAVLGPEAVASVFDRQPGHDASKWHGHPAHEEQPEQDAQATVEEPLFVDQEPFYRRAKEEQERYQRELEEEARQQQEQEIPEAHRTIYVGEEYPTQDWPDADRWYRERGLIPPWRR